MKVWSFKKKSSVETLKGQLNGKRRQETESDVRKKNETDMLLKEKNVRKLEIHGKNITHQSACDSLKKYFAAEEELREKYEVVGNLSRTANGSLTGSVKLDFETYVQRKYFRQIIQAANRRLAKMTSGGFILQCRELKDLSSQGQAGLDLDVYDLVTDSVRDVKISVRRRIIYGGVVNGVRTCGYHSEHSRSGEFGDDVRRRRIRFFG